MEKKEIEETEVITISKKSLKTAGKIVFCIYVLIFSVFMIVTQSIQTTRINELNDKFNSLAMSSNTVQTETDTLQISAMTYYKDYELTDSSDIDQIGQNGDYMIYFHSDTCHYCLEANVFLNQYITLGYQNNVPIYFATTEKASALFDDERFKVESTPTMFYYSKADNSYTSYVGSEEIFTLLDGLVTNSK